MRRWNYDKRCKREARCGFLLRGVRRGSSRDLDRSFVDFTIAYNRLRTCSRALKETATRESIRVGSDYE